MKKNIKPVSIALSHSVLLLLMFGSLAVLMLQAPIAQDLAYHEFADARSLFGIPNFYNVISNLPFLMVGIAGSVFCIRQPSSPLKTAWVTFFIGMCLVSLGSAHYHLNPNNQSLIWDRLPMTIGFMGLFSALLGEYVHISLTRYLLLPLILVGIYSVLIWYRHDDLRLYGWVQFMPLLVIPAMLCLYRKNYSHSHLLVLALFCYVIAKMLEAFDAEIFVFLQNEIAGHAIKHIFAAIGSAMILWMLRVRNHLPNTI